MSHTKIRISGFLKWILRVFGISFRRKYTRKSNQDRKLAEIRQRIAERKLELEEMRIDSERIRLESEMQEYEEEEPEQKEPEQKEPVEETLLKELINNAAKLNIGTKDKIGKDRTYMYGKQQDSIYNPEAKGQ